MLKSLAVAALLTLLIWRGMPPQVASACSGGSDFDPIASSDIVVMGTITAWEKVSTPTLLPTFQPIRLTITVDQTLKGPHSATVHAYDVASLINDAQGPISGRWAGSSGACGAFNTDPAGMYVFLGLHRDEDGTLRTNLLRTFYIGERSEFAGFRYERTREVMASFGLILPPSTGSGGLVQAPARGDASTSNYGSAAAVVVSVTLVAIATRPRSRGT